MKRLILSVGFVLGALVLSACGGKGADMSEYVQVDFNGMDTVGYADYYIDFQELFIDVLGHDESEDIADDKTQEAMNDIYEIYKISIDKEDELSNGDKVVVKVSVKEDNEYKITGGEQTFTVEGLEEPEVLTSKEVEDNIVINFAGSDGAGTATIESIFSGDLANLSFEVENNGTLENGKQANIVLSEDSEYRLMEYKYVTEEDFNPSFEVKGLEEIPKTAKDIKNYRDVERMIEEQASRSFEDNMFDKYKYKLETMMYRQFDDNDDDAGMYSSNEYDGNLIGIYSVKVYKDNEKGELRNEYTEIIGFSNLVLDENGEVNVANLKEISDSKDKSYSLESVLKLYEGYGYDYVEKNDKKEDKKDDKKDDKDEKEDKED